MTRPRDGRRRIVTRGRRSGRSPRPMVRGIPATRAAGPSEAASRRDTRRAFIQAAERPDFGRGLRRGARLFDPVLMASVAVAN
jgi:hypothetical protein